MNQVEKDSSTLMSKRQLRAFERDGFIVLRGLFGEEEIEQMVEGGEALVETSKQTNSYTFSFIEKNLIYGASPFIRENDEALQIFRKIALRSKLPQICAELMQLDPNTQSLRLLRDVYLAKDCTQDDTCSWHVDDTSFWPESFISSASEESGKDQYGINVWIALDDYDPSHGGSMVLSRGSHKASWREEAYRSIGQDRTTDGGKELDEFIEYMTTARAKGTCALDISNPTVYAKAERAKVAFKLKKGDCILATRLLFHRTERVTEKGVKAYAKQGKDQLHRYSLRYVPGTARLNRGVNFEPSTKWNEDFKGKSLDDISSTDSPAWYPKLWPQIEPNLDNKLQSLKDHELVKATARADADRKVFMEKFTEAMAKSSTPDQAMKPLQTK